MHFEIPGWNAFVHLIESVLVFLATMTGSSGLAIIILTILVKLAMVPLTRSVFWGPMAWAIMGGLAVATLLTLVFLPALYAAVYGAKRPTSSGTPLPVKA